MGVNGLWTVLEPCARPTNLATLNRKRLAVDASIWIYQFLKAVRDKEGNALRNSHVVGFFRRICKLLWFGIRPVFVFDGGAPALKRQTIQGRKRRREGRRDDAVRTAGKLLAVQMQRAAEEEDQKRRREAEREARRARGRDGSTEANGEPEEEAVPSADQLVYVDEVGMSQQERQASRKFFKKDQYHLPEMDGDISSMARPDDPRIMSVQELEEYARQFHNGEDVNLYDFSKIDFEGEFFKSLPPPDRYNILNAARLRSRLRMGLGKEQLEDMFPDRMAFSRFQIQRVQERNNLTQRLMKEAGMTGLDLTITGGGRIAGEKDREYILVKNEGAEGGWALGVVSKEKDVGEAHKPIDVDQLEFQYQTKDEKPDSEEEEEFEDIPVEGLNRLPKLSQDRPAAEPVEDEDSLFVDGDGQSHGQANFEADEALHPEEEHDIDQAIALSLRNQHGADHEPGEKDDDVQFEDVEMPAPEWEQKAVPQSKPIVNTSGRMVAHIVNNRSNAAVPKRRESAADSDSGSEDDLQAAKAASRRARKAQPKPAQSNVKNPFDGPLPFPKLDLGFSFSANKPRTGPKNDKKGGDKPLQPHLARSDSAEPDRNDDEGMAGGFEKETAADAPKPLPPWMTDETDIRETMAQQQEREAEINARDREEAEEEERLFRRRHQKETIAIESSDDESDVEILEKAPSPAAAAVPPEEEMLATSSFTGGQNVSENVSADTLHNGADQFSPEGSPEKATSQAKSQSMSEPESEDVDLPDMDEDDHQVKVTELPDSPPLEMEDVQIPAQPAQQTQQQLDYDADLVFEEVLPPPASTSGEPPENAVDPPGDDLFGESDVDEYSDPEDEELYASLAQEAEEHARFASELNNKSEQENREAYERELKALRSQQKKDRRDADEVTQVMVTECQALLRLFGIPYITAPMEAEAQCAELVHLGLVDGIVTDDSDTFLFGGTRVYKNMFNSNKLVECYLASDLEKELSLSRDQLVSVALLLGSDYTDGLPGVGPVTALEILSEFPATEGGLAAFRDWWSDVQAQRRPKADDAASPFRRKFRKNQATKLFLPVGFPNPAVREAYLHPQVDDASEAFQWGVPDLEGLRQFLMATIGWGKERTDEVLVPVIRDMNKRDVEGTQSNITRFFEGGVGVGAKESFAPRQRPRASKRMVQAVSRMRENAGMNPVAAGLAASASTPVDWGKRKRTENDAAGREEDGTAGNGDASAAAGNKGGGRGKTRTARGKRVKASS